MDAFYRSVFTAGPPSLGLQARPGTLPQEAVRAAVTAATEQPAPDRDGLILVQGISLLWHDHWNRAHEIAQSREGASDFDLLHAILHRREGDFGNSGYWFRAAGKHPCYLILERRLAEAEGGLQAVLPGKSRWTAEAFLDRVRTGVNGSDETKATLMRAQAEEFRAYAEWLLSSR